VLLTAFLDHLDFASIHLKWVHEVLCIHIGCSDVFPI